jgi:hypothetical protein
MTDIEKESGVTKEEISPAVIQEMTINHLACANTVWQEKCRKLEEKNTELSSMLKSLQESRKRLNELVILTPEQIKQAGLRSLESYATDKLGLNQECRKHLKSLMYLLAGSIEENNRRNSGDRDAWYHKFTIAWEDFIEAHPDIMDPYEFINALLKD